MKKRKGVIIKENVIYFYYNYILFYFCVCLEFLSFGLDCWEMVDFVVFLMFLNFR